MRRGRTATKFFENRSYQPANQSPRGQPLRPRVSPAGADKVALHVRQSAQDGYHQPPGHRRGPQPGAEARAAHGPTLETDRRAEGATLAELARSYHVGKSTIPRLA